MKKYFLPTLIFLLAATLSLFNIQHFPKMVGDEGIYVSQAFWLSHMGKLGPYTYWYDHFPLGWAQIGLWQLLTGTTTFFGSSVLSARVLIGLVLAGSATLLYLLTRKLTRSTLTSLTTTLIFTTSALTQTFGRMVLLDNLAIFWLLLSLLLLLTNPKSLKLTTLSSLFLVVAILTKESLLFFLPPYLFLFYSLTRPNVHHRYSWLISGITILFFLSFFPLLALLKGELLPTPHRVSLLGTILFQAGRGSGIPFWQTGSHFREMLSVWLQIDPILTTLGSLSTILLLIFGTPLHRLLSLFPLFFVLFLLRGGQIYDFYLIPLLPFLSLAISLLLSQVKFFTSSRLLKMILPLSFLAYALVNNRYPWTSRATIPQLEAKQTLTALSSNEVILAPDYFFLDSYLNNPKRIIHWYKKADSDPAVNANLRPTYVLKDAQFTRELVAHELPVLDHLLQNITLSDSFGSPTNPGYSPRPYTHEFLQAYLVKDTPSSNKKTVFSLSFLTPSTQQEIISSAPDAILLTSESFTTSQELETTLTTLKSLVPDIPILVIQDSEGNNTIPWISSVSRSFYKSAEEAKAATSRKAQSLASLGFTGALIASSNNQDGYLQTIVEAAQNYLTPFVRYNSTIPSFPTNLVVSNIDELEQVRAANYSGNVYLLNVAEKP